jgi:hypothetical protein
MLNSALRFVPPRLGHHTSSSVVYSIASTLGRPSPARSPTRIFRAPGALQDTRWVAPENAVGNRDVGDADDALSSSNLTTTRTQRAHELEHARTQVHRRDTLCCLCNLESRDSKQRLRLHLHCSPWVQSFRIVPSKTPTRIWYWHHCTKDPHHHPGRHPPKQYQEHLWPAHRSTRHTEIGQVHSIRPAPRQRITNEASSKGLTQ